MKIHEIMEMTMKKKPTDSSGTASDLDKARASIIKKMDAGQKVDIDAELKAQGFVNITWEEIFGTDEMSEHDKHTVAKAMVGQKVTLNSASMMRIWDAGIEGAHIVYGKNVAIDAIITEFDPHFTGGLGKETEDAFKRLYAQMDPKMVKDIEQFYPHGGIGHSAPGAIKVKFTPEPAYVEYEDTGDDFETVTAEVHSGTVLLHDIYSLVPVDPDEKTKH